MKVIALCLIALLGQSWAAAAQSMVGDARRGQHVFRKCLLCHEIQSNAKDMLAPPLSNVIGRPAASIDGFVYSDIIKIAGRKGLTWSPEALDLFLDRPDVFMPGTYMAFPGIDQPERADVIAYLLKLTKDTNEAARKAAAESARQADPTRRKALPSLPPSASQPPPPKPAQRPATERRNPYLVQ